MTGGAAHGFVHEAVLYQGLDEFVALVGSFIDEGVARGEPVLVLTDPERVALMQDRFTGTHRAAAEALVRYGDLHAVGRNPARLLSTWCDLLDEFAGQRVRGVSEAVWPGRSADELDECRLHEALLDMAFVAGPEWHLLCPYDAARLDAEALSIATDHHHVLITADGRDVADASSTGVHGPAIAAALFARPFAPVPDGVDALAFDRATLIGLRHHVRGEAVRVGIGGERAEDFTLAVDEVATNSVVHGGGSGTLRLWLDHRTLICEVSDDGQMTSAMPGRRRPRPHQEGGRGLWMANQLCDLVQMRSPAGGAVTRLHMRVA